jgi:hypothetical protein
MRASASFDTMARWGTIDSTCQPEIASRSSIDERVKKRRWPAQARPM